MTRTFSYTNLRDAAPWRLRAVPAASVAVCRISTRAHHEDRCKRSEVVMLYRKQVYAHDYNPADARSWDRSVSRRTLAKRANLGEIPTTAVML